MLQRTSNCRRWEKYECSNDSSCDNQQTGPARAVTSQIAYRSIVNSCNINKRWAGLVHWCVHPVLTHLLTYSIQQSPSWEANLSSASQEIPLIVWNPKVHFLIPTCPPPVPILSIIDRHQNISPCPRPSVWTFRNVICFYSEELLPPRPTPQAGGPPRVGCPRLHIQYIRSYRPYGRPHTDTKSRIIPLIKPLLVRLLNTIYFWPTLGSPNHKKKTSV